VQSAGWLSSMTALGLAFAVLVSGCGVTERKAPQAIDADGQTYIGCHDPVWVTTDGGAEVTYSVKFTDASGSATTLKGVKKLRLVALPAETPSCR